MINEEFVPAKNVDVLGKNYKIIYAYEKDYPKLTDTDSTGLCEVYANKIIIKNIMKDKSTYDNIEDFSRETLRHEIAHAFIHESGYNLSAADEENLVIWISTMFECLAVAYASTGALSTKTKMAIKKAFDKYKHDNDKNNDGDSGLSSTFYDNEVEDGIESFES